MGAAPSRETHRRGLFTVNQGSSSGVGSKKQDIVLIPLTREYFPSPDCPLFVQFHKARCDAAVNYYFRRPGDPGDLSTIPNYAGSTRMMPEERMRRRRRKLEVAAQRKRKAEEEAAAKKKAEEEGAAAATREGHLSNSNADEGLEEIVDQDLEQAQPEHPAGNDGNTAPEENKDAHATEKGEDGPHDADGTNADDEDDDGISSVEEDDSYPSREALYRGVIDHVEEVLFDTDEEMRQAYAYHCSHPNATVGPDGQKLRKVLPILCAVAFRADVSKLPGTHSHGDAAPQAAAAPSDQQILLESGVLLHGNILNIVGCFGFVSMQEEVDAILQLQQQRQGGGLLASPTSPMGLMGSAGAAAGFGGRSPGSSYRHDPYSYPGSQPSTPSVSVRESGALNMGMSSSPPAAVVPPPGVAAGASGAVPIPRPGGSSVDLVTLPQPVAAPLAALVFLTKSAGEQNLGRVTHIAATTYYYQLIQAGVIQRRGAAMVAADPHHPHHPPPPSQPMYNPSGTSPYMGPGTPTSAHGAGGGGSRGFYGRGSYNPATYPPTSPLTSMPELFQPPMETFSFSSLLTNIPILSFLYEMKCRWGYLGVLKGGTPTANGSFASSSVLSFPSFSLPAGRRPGTMMGNHSTGGLAAVDPYSGQDVTDEMEMWITPDEMIHGRISRDLASRLCLSLAERPEVMQERVSQLPSEEDGYWRYRGLVGRLRPPPVPGPGRIVSINPKDVYVVGSDVLPGFDEGDILRFDPERMVWFADHSIPLEGVVLAAMRPYCKAAREADPTDPNWVTRLAPREEVDYLREVKGEEEFPAPPASAEQQQAMTADPDLRVVHEHEGNFYVYRFERDGATYYHGTIPNFANPNKRRNNAGGPGANLTAAAQAPVHSVPPASTAVAADQSDMHKGAAVPGKSTGAEKPAVQAPKTIASALFSLFPGSPKPTPAEGDTTAAPTNANPNASRSPASPVAAAAAATAPSRAAMRSASREQNFPTTGRAATGTQVPPSVTAMGQEGQDAEIPAYLRGRVTSTAIDAARKLVMNLYSYAYGAPVRAGGAVPPSPHGSKGVRTPTGATTAPPVGRGATVAPTSYPPSSPNAPYGTNVGAPPTAAALHAQNMTYHSPSSNNNGSATGGGMYPRNYRLPSSAARSSANSTPAVRHVNPSHVGPVALPPRSPSHSGTHYPMPHQPQPPHWPQSPESNVGPTFVYPHAQNPSEGRAGGDVSHHSQGPNVPNVHVRVGSRGGTTVPLPHPFEESMSYGAGGAQGASMPRPISQGDIHASKNGAAPPPYFQPSSPTQQQPPPPPPARRYTDGGNYVWDWRAGGDGAAGM